MRNETKNVLEMLKDIKKNIENYKAKIENCNILIEDYTKKGKAISSKGGDSSIYYSNMKAQEVRKEVLVQALKDFESLVLVYEDDILEETEKAKDEKAEECESKLNDADNTIMWLCGYIMELHEFRDGILRVNCENKSLENVMDYVIESFPQLQGTKAQRQFEHFGKQVNAKDIQSETKNTLKRIESKLNS